MFQLDYYPTLDLPSYTPSAPLPCYSLDLACGERRLEHTPRTAASSSTPTATFVRQAGTVTVSLNDQEEGARIPTYGRRAVISGSICLERPENVLEVVAIVSSTCFVVIKTRT